jgi:predicted ATPase
MSLSRESPLLLFLDILHRADASSLQLLHQLARNLKCQPLILLGAYRDTDVERMSTLAQLLLDLNREHLMDEVHLVRLGVPDVTRMMPEALSKTAVVKEESKKSNPGTPQTM